MDQDLQKDLPADSLLRIVATKPEWVSVVPGILDQPCLPVDLADPRIRTVLPDVVYEMFRTLYISSGLGLAAPQVGIRWRLIVVDTTGGLRSRDRVVPEDERRRLVLINPEILPGDGADAGRGTESFPENCLSLPGFVGAVVRPWSVRVRYSRLDGTPVDLQAGGLLARVILHEVDHLDGVLFTQRMREQGGAWEGADVGGRYGARARASLVEAGLREAG